MALASSVIFTFVDSNGKRGRTKIRVPNGFSIAQYREFGQAMAQVFVDVSHAQVEKVQIAAQLDLSSAGLDAIATITSDRFQKLHMTFRSAVAGFRKLIQIPAFDEGFLIAGSQDLDLSHPDVDAVETVMIDGIVTSGGTIQPVTERGYDLTATESGNMKFRKK